jgi:hypothetical protein
VNAAVPTPMTRQGAHRGPRPKHASKRHGLCHSHRDTSSLVRAHKPGDRSGGSRFLQTDPIEGSGPNAYDYVGQDPINRTDLNGQCWGFCWVSHAARWAAHKVVKHWRIIAQVATFAAGVAAIGAVCGMTALLGCMAAGMVIGGASAAARYVEGSAGTRHFSTNRLLFHTTVGFALGYALYPWRVLAGGSFLKWGISALRWW